jgi:hypothetical protein
MFGRSMTSQFDFSNDEWDQVASVPYLVGLAVARAEDSGLVGSFRESRALLTTIAAQSEAEAASGLIAQAATTDVTELYEQYKAASAEALATDAVAACRQLVAVLDRVAQGPEAERYKQWVLDVAWTVAETAKEHGQRVSAGEAAILRQVTGALGLPPRSGA